MKGQSALISEVLLFMLGIMIAYFVYMSLGILEKNVRQTSVNDRMAELSDLIVSGIYKSYMAGENSSIIINVPKYEMENFDIYCYGNNVTVYSVSDEKMRMTREIFNISAAKTISGDVTSDSKYISITNEPGGIFIKRMHFG